MLVKYGNSLLFALVIWLFFALVSDLRADENPAVIAATQNSAPKYFDIDNNRRGVCGDIYENLARRMMPHDVVVKTDPGQLPIKRILHNVENGSMHLFCGAGRNAKREKRFHYSSSPVWHTSNVVITSKANPVEKLSFEQLAQDRVIIGAFFGTSSARFLMKQPNIRVDDGYKSLQAALQDVANGHLAYFYYHDLGLNYLLLENPALPARMVPTKFRTVPQWIIFSRHLDDQLRDLLDQEVTNMVKAGDVRTIMARYQPGS